MLLLIMIIDREQLKTKLRKDLKTKSAAQLADEIGILHMTLWRIMKGGSEGSITTWETIAEYYRNDRHRASV